MVALTGAPFEDDPPPKPRMLVKPPPTFETTECNYLVMFFVIGVFVMALGDMLTE
jgi:hypothetical protein